MKGWYTIKDIVKDKANMILKNAYGSEAEFRDGQLEAIQSVLEKNKTLVVQKTGWGKSIVYFIATKILIDNGAGPTIIISPLLALMKNQIDSAKTLGINAVTINSDNRSEWESIYKDINKYDLIIISPERLSNEKFKEILSEIRNVQLFVVDEAHSISDWGHDFRPDYQRIVKLLDNFPADIAILGTTATANDRVIKDIKDQLGKDLIVLRGNLMRDNLAIQINPKQTVEEKLSWVAQILRNDYKLMNKQGIIYCLTQRECDDVAEYLKKYKIKAESYHSGLGKDEYGNDIAKMRLERFDKGETKVLVSTIKLGMGYDKSDIRFIIHFQLPQNLISYYQQIGRAGRDGNPAYTILLYNDDDEKTIEYFIRGAQSSPELLSDIFELTKEGYNMSDILSKINVNYSKLNEALKYLQVHNYVYKDKNNIYRKNINSIFDGRAERIKQNELNIVRQDELNMLKKFLTVDSCYMKYIAKELNAPDIKEYCGICTNCLGKEIFNLTIEDKYLKDATDFLKNRHGKIFPRKKWANNKLIPKELIMKEGWILSDNYYSEEGKKVREGKYKQNSFSSDLVLKSKEFLIEKIMEKEIDLLVAVPSKRRPNLVPQFAEEVAIELGLPFKNAVIKKEMASEQKELNNSAMQQQNIVNSIEIDDVSVKDKTILIIDDMVDSRWTFTVIAAKLLKAGAKNVYPYALVKTGSGN